jgi:hypothetical protein
MFCPKCHAEYRPEIFQCNDCAVDLVTELPLFSKPISNSPISELFDPSNWESDDTVTLFESENLVKIALAKTHLEDAGISYFVSFATVGGRLGRPATVGGNYGSGPIQIKVKKSDAQVAVAVIKKIESQGQ